MATGLLDKGGGLPGLVSKQQAVEFPQVLASRITMLVQIKLYAKTAQYFSYI